MDIAIIVSTKDSAGMNIKKALVEAGFAETEGIFEGHLVLAHTTPAHNLRLFTIETDTIQAEGIDEKLGAEILVFATKHKSKSAIPSLTVHAPGNFREAKFGGAEGKLCITSEPYMKRSLMALASNLPPGYEIITEATHHGPIIQKPCFFIELGSDEKHWQDPKGAKAIASAIITAFSEHPLLWKCAIAFGGPHHGPGFRNIAFGEDYAISHHCPKYALSFLNADIIEQMRTRSMRTADIAFIDWKGLGRERKHVMKLIETSGIPFLKL